MKEKEKQDQTCSFLFPLIIPAHFIVACSHSVIFQDKLNIYLLSGRRGQQPPLQPTAAWIDSCIETFCLSFTVKPVSAETKKSPLIKKKKRKGTDHSEALQRRKQTNGGLI